MNKVTIIGTGSVGSTIAYTLTVANIATEIIMIDINGDKAIGEAADIAHGLPFLGSMNVYAGDYSCVKDCDVIVVTAGANRKVGETRLDLARKNTAIAKDITTNIMKYYNGGVILVVAKPVDILTYMISKWTGLPNGMVLGSGTTLDTIRFRSALASITDIDCINIHGYIIGEHGDSQVPVWSNTHIAGIQVDDFCKMMGVPLDDKIK